MFKGFLHGNLTKDVELLEVTKKEDGTKYKVAKFTVAVNRVGMAQKDKVIFVRVESWGGQAEVCAKYLKKGSGVTLCGDIDIEEWTDGENKKIKKKDLKIINPEIEFTDRNPENAADSGKR